MARIQIQDNDQKGQTSRGHQDTDITGKIVEIGSLVDENMLDKSVVLFPFTSSGEAGSEHIADEMAFIGSEYDGVYAEYVAWPAELCFDMPLDSYLDSTVFSVSGLTAWHMAKQIDIQPGQSVMVTGANGGVGSLSTQIKLPLMFSEPK